MDPHHQRPPPVLPPASRMTRRRAPQRQPARPCHQYGVLRRRVNFDGDVRRHISRKRVVRGIGAGTGASRAGLVAGLAPQQREGAPTAATAGVESDSLLGEHQRLVAVAVAGGDARLADDGPGSQARRRDLIDCCWGGFVCGLPRCRRRGWRRRLGRWRWLRRWLRRCLRRCLRRSWRDRSRRCCRRDRWSRRHRRHRRRRRRRGAW